MNRRAKQLLLWLPLGAVTLVTLTALGFLVASLLEDPLLRSSDVAELRSQVEGLETELSGLRLVLDEAQDQNSNLKSRFEGSLLTLQEVYFEQLKKNDGLAAVWTDPRPGRRAYLTFDDGPSENTTLVLDALKAQKATAAFFVNGRTDRGPLYKRIVAEGNRIGNHTYSHDYNKVYTTVKAYLQDSERLEAFLATVGLPPTRLYRFPGGAKNEIAARIGGPDLTGKVSAAMADKGYRFFEWNVAVGEGESRPDSLKYTAKEIRRSVAAQVKSKRIAVILLHDGPGHRETALAVPGILTDLKKMGFTIEALP